MHEHDQALEQVTAEPVGLLRFSLSKANTGPVP